MVMKCPVCNKFLFWWRWPVIYKGSYIHSKCKGIFDKMEKQQKFNFEGNK